MHITKIPELTNTITWHATSLSGLGCQQPNVVHEVLVYDGYLDDVVKGHLDAAGQDTLVWIEQSTGCPLRDPQWWAEVPFPGGDGKFLARLFNPKSSYDVPFNGKDNKTEGKSVSKTADAHFWTDFVDFFIDTAEGQKEFKELMRGLLSSPSKRNDKLLIFTSECQEDRVNAIVDLVGYEKVVVNATSSDISRGIIPMWSTRLFIFDEETSADKSYQFNLMENGHFIKRLVSSDPVVDMIKYGHPVLDDKGVLHSDGKIFTFSPRHSVIIGCSALPVNFMTENRFALMNRMVVTCIPGEESVGINPGDYPRHMKDFRSWLER